MRGKDSHHCTRPRPGCTVIASTSEWICRVMNRLDGRNRRATYVFTGQPESVPIGIGQGHCKRSPRRSRRLRENQFCPFHFALASASSHSRLVSERSGRAYLWRAARKIHPSCDSSRGGAALGSVPAPAQRATKSSVMRFTRA